MPQLIIEQPGIPPMTVELKGSEVTFGRAEENEIVLVADEVSRHHAKIRLLPDRTILDDLKSLNGTYVNRQRIVERVLADNDEVWFGGKCRARFKDDTEEEKKRKLHEQQPDSDLSHDLDKIRAEMDEVTNTMTMMAPSSTGAATIAGEVVHEAGAVEVDKLRHAFRRLDALYKATQLISGDLDLEKRMIQVLDLAIEVTNASRGFLMMREEGTDNIEMRVAREMGQELTSSSPSMGIARSAAIDGAPVLMADSGADANFGGRESIIRQQIRSAMCVPLRIEDRILGSLYVDSSQANIKFNEADLELFQAMANQSAMAIENVRLYKEAIESEKKRNNLGRFLSPAVVDVIMEHEDSVELGGQSKVVSTMFCDIRGFTNMSERMTPDALVSLLNGHFTAMTEIVFEYGGTLDKYNGDEVMALFGAPLGGENDGEQAILAAIAMQKKNGEMNIEREKNGQPTFEMGIGITTGEVIVGYIGSPVRMDFTVMGDAVNTASRFCSHAKGTQIITGERTYQLAKESVEMTFIGTPSLKGKDDAVKAYLILGLKSSDGAEVVDKNESNNEPNEDGGPEHHHDVNAPRAEET